MSMAKQLVLNTDAAHSYLHNFINETFPKPSREPQVYDIANKFFYMIRNARNALEQVLLSADWDSLQSDTTAATLEVGVDLLVISSAHTKVSDEHIKDLLTIFGHDADDKDKIKWLTGHSGTMLSNEGKSDAKKSKNKGQIVICSDLPRAIHCAMLKYYPESEAQLDEIAVKVVNELITNNGVIAAETYVSLVTIALVHNIVPTMLARAGFYGPMELFPEKGKEFDAERIIASGFGDILGHSENEVRLIAKMAKQRGDSTFHAVDEEGLPTSEDRLMFYLRVKPMLDLFFPGTQLYERSKGKSIDIVAHSGLTDVIAAYYRHFRKPGDFFISREPKTLTRGKEYVFKLESERGASGKEKKSFVYLNDFALLEPIKAETRRKIEEIRSRSLDDRIRMLGAGVVETPLIGFKELQQKPSQYETYKTNVQEALDSALPVIIFGHGGQGKSILMTEIAKKLIDGPPERASKEEKETWEKYANYVPVLIEADELNRQIDSRNAQSSEDVKHILRAQIEKEHLAECLTRECRFVVMIDDYQKVNPSYDPIVIEAVHSISASGSLVVLFSRLERADLHPPVNKGYLTMQIDSSSIPKTIDEYVNERVSKEKLEEFKAYISQYDESITGNFITLHVLTMIFSDAERVLKYYKEGTNLHTAITSGKTLTRTELYEIQTDFVIGKEIKRKDSSAGTDKVRDEITAHKRQLAEFAFKLVMGEKYQSEVSK